MAPSAANSSVRFGSVRFGSVRFSLLSLNRFLQYVVIQPHICIHNGNEQSAIMT